MISSIQFTLSYSGRDAEEHEIDLYDVGQALIGFQRSLALTTHLVLNGEIITQAPRLKNARILASPPKEGSWEVLASIGIIAGGVYKLGTAPKDSPIGHVVRSAYDYVVHETLGFHVDYDQSIGQQIEAYKETGGELPDLSLPRLSSLREKCERAIKEMHRPLVESETATKAQIIATIGKSIINVARPLTPQTYQYMNQTDTAEAPVELSGRVTSYNSNTFKGRIYLEELGRPVPFELRNEARNINNISLVTKSLDRNAMFQANKEITDGFIIVRAFKNRLFADFSG